LKFWREEIDSAELAEVVHKGPYESFCEKRAASRAVSWFLALIAVLMFVVPSQAQVQRSFINQGFEQPVLVPSNAANGCYVQVTDGTVPGWSTTHPNVQGSGNCTSPSAASGALIELWRAPFNGVTAAEGSQFAELNAERASRLYQTVCLVAGEQFAYRFSHRSRSGGNEVADFNIAPTANGTRTQIVRSTVSGSAWANRTGTYTFPGPSGVQTLGFEAIGGTTAGNFLDNIQITLTPYLEFVPGNSSGLESIATANLPALRVAGLLNAPTSVEIQITGGTATLGTDYTTPSGTNTFTVTIPAGNYDGTQPIATGMAIINDTLIEPDETIQLTITPNPASYTIASTQSCGATPSATGTYTIIDDDARITVQKTLAGPRVAASDQFALSIAGTNGPVNVNTTGAGTTVNGQAQLSNIAVNTNYTISEAMAAGSASPQSSYAPNLTCSNAKAGSPTVLPGGAVRTGTIRPIAGDDITCVFNNAPRNPAITIAKSAGAIADTNGSGAQDAGDRVPYTFTVTNSGNTTLTNVRINDAKLDAAAVCSPTTLAPGAVATCTGTHTLTQAEVTAGQVVNTATATGSPPEGGSDVTSPPATATVPITQAPKLTITKSAGPIVDANGSGRQDAGDKITYTFTVKNTGNVPLTGVNVDDARIGVTDLAVSPATLAPGATGTASVTYTLIQSDIDSGTVNNSATGSGRPPSGGEVTSPPSTTTTPITGATSIVLTKTASAINDLDGNGPDEGDTISYTFTVKNTGTVTLNPVTVNDPLLGGAITCPVAPLAAGATASCGAAVTYTLTQSDINAGQVVNTATATGTPPSGPPVTNSSSTTTPIAQTRQLTVTKTASLADTVVVNGTADAGEVITYGVSVKNTGNVTVTALTVTDSLDGAPATTLSCSPQTLAPGATATCTAYTHTVTQAEIDQQAALRNVVTAAGNTSAGRVTGTDTKTVPPTRRSPGVSITKTVDRNTISAPGTLNYTIVVRNTGNTTLTGVNVTDTLPNGDPATLPLPNESVTTNGVLDVGESWTYTLAYPVDQATIDNPANTTLTNRASVTTTQTPTPASSRADTQIVRNAAFTTKKTVDKATISAPGTLTYTIVLTNTGNVSLTGVTPTDTLPNGDPAVLPAPTESISANNVLNVGETWTYVFTYAVDQAAIEAGGTLVNTVQVTTTQTPSPQDSATTTITQFHSLAVEKKVDKASVSAPGLLNYTITVKNTGNVALSNVTPVDTLPNGTTVTLANPTGDVNGDGKLDVGETWTYTTTYSVTQAEIEAGTSRVNSVSVTSAETPTPKTADATTTISQAPSMTVAKTVDTTAISAPATLNYTITVKNTGNVSLGNVTPTDTLPNGTTVTLANPSGDANNNGRLDIGETWTYTTTYAVDQAQINAGTDRVNSVTVTANPPSGPALSGSSSATTTITTTPKLTIAKRVDKTSISAPGTLTYTIEVRNTGNVSLTGVSVTDTLAPGARPINPGAPVESVSNNGVLDVGETWTYTATFAVAQSDIDAGTSLVNTASVTSTQTPTPVDASATTTISQAASMHVEKVVDLHSIAAPGTLTYTITVENTGNVSLNNVTPVDTLPNGTTVTLANPGGDTNGNGRLDVGETWTYTTTYAVDQAQINAGTDRVNSVTVTADPPSGGAVSKTDTATTTIATAPRLTVDKRVDKTVISAPGTLTYTIEVHNAGNVSLTGVSVTDTLAPGARPINPGAPVESVSNNGVLDVGETWTYTATFAVAQSDIDAGTSLVNTASVTSTQTPAPVDASATTTISQAASMEVVKTVNPTAITGPATLNYTITVKNTGNVSLGNVNPTDTLPNGTTVTLANPGGDANNNGRLDVGETWTYTTTYAVDQAQIDAGTDRVNAVTVTANPPSGPALSGSSSATTTITKTPKLTVAKRVDKTSISAPGTLTYTIEVRNAGNVSLTGVGVTDTLAPGARPINPGSPVESVSNNNVLDVGETWTYTATFDVLQADIEAGTSLVNTASVTSTQTPTPVDASATTTISQAPAMLVKKAVDRQSISAPGTLVYTITVENTGNVSLGNVNPVDTLPNGTTATLANPSGDTNGNGRLDTGEVWTYTTTYAVDQAQIDAGTDRINSVTVTANPPSGPALSGSSSATTTITSAPKLTIAKRVDKTSISAPGTLTYTIDVHNTGNVSLTGVSVTDTLAPGARPINVGSPSESISTNNVLDVGETWTYTATFAVSQADVEAGTSLVNTASVTSTQTPTPVDASATTTISQAPAMQVKKEVDRQAITGPATLTYTITVENTGNVSLSNVNPVDTLPNGTTVTLANPSGDTNGNGKLDIDEIWTYTTTYAVDQAQINAGTDRINAVTITANPPSGAPVSKTDTATTTISRTPGLKLVKSATSGNGYTAVGNVVTYSYLVTNSGNTTITSPISVADDKIAAPNTVSCPALPAGGLDPDKTLTCTASYTITQADLNAGKVTNTATATDGTTTSPPSTVTVTAVQSPALTLVKNVTAGDPYAAVNDVVTYSYVVTNSGNVTITEPISVDDNKITPVTCPALPAGGLEPTRTLTCTASYTVTQADLNAGSVTNTATATDGATTSSPASKTVNATQRPTLTLVKTATVQDTNGNGRTDVGDTIVYAFRVENTGNVVLRNVKVTDTLVDIVLTGGPIATLQPAAVDTTTFKATYLIKQTDLDNGSVVNQATASGASPAGGAVDSPPSAVTTPLVSAASLTFKKTAGKIVDVNGNGRTDPGDTVTYDFAITNTGTVTLTNLKIDDARIGVAGLAVMPATLAPNAAGTATATYALTQADIDSGRVVNQATATGTPPSGPPVTATSDDPTLPGDSDPTVVPIDSKPALALKKTADALRDDNGDGVVGGEGDKITYRYEVTNTGSATLRDVAPLDAGPTFNGKPAANKLSSFSPASVAVLTPGAVATFSATYVLGTADVDSAAGIADGVKNTATGEAYANGDRTSGTRIVSPASTALVALPTGKPGTLTLVKQAGIRQIRIGEKAPFVISATNNEARNVGPVTIVDTIPVGFRFVVGSASIDGTAVTPEVSGRQVIFRNINFGPNAKVQIRLQMLALNTAGPGRHTNRALATDERGTPLSDEASAWVEIVAEPVFDCGDIIGKVFDDKNGNGYQDEGEPGLPGVRVVTVRGLLITTDQYGRFHVACADLPDKRIGSNFIMKLDERTLPSGYRLTTENPRVVRLTAGKMTKLNFGARIGRVVRLDLKDEAFQRGSTALDPKWLKGLDQLIAVLAREQSVLRLSYIEPGADEQLARSRVQQLEKEISQRWSAVDGRYRLEIETRIETGR
jgi:uncharacterized repeat protein (TIGR01451 family)